MSVSVFSALREQLRQKKFRDLLPRIHEHQRRFAALPDSEFPRLMQSLALRLRAGEAIARLIPETFSLVREAARRVLHVEHYDVQLIAGMALTRSSIAEMQTGEGKTLTATLPLSLFALAGRGAHLVTDNDYLAERDAGWVRPLFQRLGFSVGVVLQTSSDHDRQAAYTADITYGTLKEFAFDFLKDRLRSESRSDSSQSHLFFADRNSERSSFDRPYYLLVDEADSQLIDEARTPLIISVPDTNRPLMSEECFHWACAAARNFEQKTHHQRQTGSRRIVLTDEGRTLLRRLLSPESVPELTWQNAEIAVCRALSAAECFTRNEDYIVNGAEVILVDQSTGRTTPGRQLRDGLHQALQANESLQVTPPLHTAARATVHGFVSRYEHVSGMTGTAREASPEFKSIYGLSLDQIPTHRPSRRVVLPELFFITAEEKYSAIADEVAQMTSHHRPVLIGTRTIRQSIEIAAYLGERGFEPAVLNGVQDAREAEIVARAGEPSRITVATNMAGRGTDISLSPAVVAAGGLHVIGTEYHESRRIDRQLAGRCARQGDPGSYRQMGCLEDALLLEAGGEAFVIDLIQSAQKAFSTVESGKLFQWAQRTVERKHARERGLLIESERQRLDKNTQLGRDPWLDDLE